MQDSGIGKPRNELVRCGSGMNALGRLCYQMVMHFGMELKAIKMVSSLRIIA